jgi:hypothetical protein
MIRESKWQKSVVDLRLELHDFIDTYSYCDSKEHWYDISIWFLDIDISSAVKTKVDAKQKEALIVSKTSCTLLWTVCACALFCHQTLVSVCVIASIASSELARAFDQHGRRIWTYCKYESESWHMATLLPEETNIWRNHCRQSSCMQNM